MDAEPKPVPRALRGIARAWVLARASGSDAIPRPVDSPDQRLPGPDPVHMLVVGAGAAAGWGVRSHELGFTGALARRLRLATQRGVVLRSRIGLDITVDRAADVVRATRTRFDEVRVVVLGITETFQMVRPADWRRGIDDTLATLEPTADRPAVLTGIQPISSIPVYAGGLSPLLDRHAAALNRETAEACTATPFVAYAPLPAPPTVEIQRYRGPADYDFWGDQVVAPVVSLLPPPREHVEPSSYDEEVERRRQAELTRLGIRGPGAGYAVDDIVKVARAVFRTQSAELMILDGDRAWALSADGTEPHDIRRDSSFTSYAVEARGTFVVADAQADPRFRDYGFVTGEPHIRFFAAHPVEGPSGERIGALCVYDSRPREFDQAERDLLAALADRLETALGSSA